MKSWDETTVQEDGSGRKMTTAVVTYDYAAPLAGSSTVEYAMFYLTPSKAAFVGYEHIDASYGGQSGTVVLRHEGLFDNGSAEIAVQVVADSPTGTFAGASGNGTIAADATDPMKSTLTLEWRRA
ncbi:DUF3224 domain-containing protein [Pseudoduganella buxea]|nr:DUF3224 domain-containing protein [Pseudoduganella buxea]GGB95806.1 hypothetical protein GCM10011572_17230 [Pseudoduganella buxea]